MDTINTAKTVKMVWAPTSTVKRHNRKKQDYKEVNEKQTKKHKLTKNPPGAVPLLENLKPLI